MKKFLIFFAAAVAVLLLLSVISNIKSGTSKNNQVSRKSNLTSPNETPQFEVIAQNLEIPWAIGFLPNGDFLFTERSGNVKIFSKGKVSTLGKIANVKVYGEGGLLGLAIDRNYSSNHFIYFYHTFSANGNDTKNRVIRYKFENNLLTEQKILVDNIPGALHHDGGRLKFGPDGYLYVTTGDSQNPSLSQDKSSLAGKVLRIDRNGSNAPDNPFNTAVYTFGHRNPEGLAWDAQGRLWEAEHGDLATDEVNILIKGRNYGWPDVRGSATKIGIESPFVQSGKETWAPAGAVILNNSLFFGGLKGQALFEVKLNGGTAIISQHFKDQFGRIRDVVLGPDNLIYMTTSNRDGRGAVQEGDDKIIRVNPQKL